MFVSLEPINILYINDDYIYGTRNSVYRIIFKIETVCMEKL